ncbi:MAG: phytanoyl-CoA dioxygenase [Planctomycetaceae bacterium]|nr:phytanoyl-CoA dioxygenase [Planctomycetaceae bacterium]|tara:strand:- start:10754 stop:11548 length:795 start_codon:yes stop_codon:yes gene_type:complete
MTKIQFPQPRIEHQLQLDTEGFVVLHDWFHESLLASLVSETERLWELEGEQAGAEFKQEPDTRRLANLVEKSPLFSQVVQHPDALALVQHILGEFKLSSLNARSANPHSASAQPLHCDGGFLPDKQGPLVANVVWCLDDFTSQNGTLRVVPGSHRSGQLPQDALTCCLQDHPDQILVSAKAGSLIVINAHIWHSGMNNNTNKPRRALHAYYCRRDQPQQQFQQELLSLETKSEADPMLRYLLALDDVPLHAESKGINSVSGFLN